ncbi:class C sortase [Blautia sp.]
MKKKKRKKYIGFALLFLLGLSILLYPTFSDAWNQYRNAKLINTYETAVNDLPDKDYDRLWKEAKRYNREHTVNTFVDAFDEKGDYILSDAYKKILDPDGEGLMGSIEIPKIQARIAIYHGISDDVLEKGAGHVEGTSLPVGGKSTHAVLAAHRGLPSAKLFTDLDQMEIGDIFFLHILGKTLAYKVDQIKTVLPSETENLDIIKGEDHVTLLTCTPYGVNTHRLLVRGTRTKYVENKTEINDTVPQKLAQADPKKIMEIGLVVFAISVILLLIVIRYRDRKKSSI